MEPGRPRDSSTTPALPASFRIYPVPANCISFATQFSCFRSPLSFIQWNQSWTQGVPASSSRVPRPKSPVSIRSLLKAHRLGRFLFFKPVGSQPMIYCHIYQKVRPWSMSTHVHISHKYLIGNSAKGFAEIQAHSNPRLVFHCMNLVILPHYTLMKRKLAIFPLMNPSWFLVVICHFQIVYKLLKLFQILKEKNKAIAEVM